MSRLLLSFCLLLVLTLSTLAQSKGLFSDSVNVGGLSPFARVYLEQMNIRTVEEYRMGKGDSSLYRTYLFDSAFNLSRVLLHSRYGKAVVDSMTYDHDHNQTAHFIGSKYASLSRFSGDSILNQTIVQMSDGHIDTTISEVLLNSRKRPVIAHHFNPAGKLLNVYRYLYDEAGRTLQYDDDNLLHPESSYGYRYEYEQRGNTCKVILWSTQTARPVKSAEYIYNEFHQCSGWIFFTRSQNYPTICSYNTDGSLYEVSQEYRNNRNEPYQLRSRFYYH
jgi:hypothetical protein